MARYQPKSRIVVAQPCSEDWDAMQGDSRKRHCAECDRDVLNSASMTPGEIEQVLQAGAPLPCMRLAQFSDGSLLVASEVARERRALSGLSAAFISLLALTGINANAQGVPSVAPSTATISGHVVDAWGRPARNAEVVLTQTSKEHPGGETVTTDAEGRFEAKVAPGSWTVAASKGIARSQVQRMRLRPGQQRVSRALTLQQITVTAGVIAVLPSVHAPNNNK